MQQQQYFEHDRAAYPRQAYNERGEIVFDMTEAKLLLREDIKNGLHTTTYNSNIKELQASRPEYMAVFANKRNSNVLFNKRVKQEIKRNKYINYLEAKREKARNGEDEKKKSKIY